MQGVIFADFVTAERKGVSGSEKRFHGRVYHRKDG
jgi:hypothetical protein